MRRVSRRPGRTLLKLFGRDCVFWALCRGALKTRDSAWRPCRSASGKIRRDAHALSRCDPRGGIFLPLNTAYTSAELDYFLTDAEPKILVYDPTRSDDLAPVAAKAQVRAIETLGRDGSGSLPERGKLCTPDFKDVSRGPDDLAALLYTSGTTGRSKGAMIESAVVGLPHDDLG
jgi:AMP-binding enzyme